ncbi:unnamed protein product [Closterium sp. NIES-65]|nr:unnamed protein product [Closterium sp. NIES-65]
MGAARSASDAVRRCGEPRLLPARRGSIGARASGQKGVLHWRSAADAFSRSCEPARITLPILPAPIASPFDLPSLLPPFPSTSPSSPASAQAADTAAFSQGGFEQLLPDLQAAICHQPLCLPIPSSHSPLHLSPLHVTSALTRVTCSHLCRHSRHPPCHPALVSALIAPFPPPETPLPPPPPLWAAVSSAGRQRQGVGGGAVGARPRQPVGGVRHHTWAGYGITRGRGTASHVGGVRHHTWAGYGITRGRGTASHVGGVRHHTWAGYGITRGRGTASHVGGVRHHTWAGYGITRGRGTASHVGGVRHHTWAGYGITRGRGTASHVGGVRHHTWAGYGITRGRGTASHVGGVRHHTWAGYGITRVLEGAYVLDKAAANVSIVRRGRLGTTTISHPDNSSCPSIPPCMHRFVPLSPLLASNGRSPAPPPHTPLSPHLSPSPPFPSARP